MARCGCGNGAGGCSCLVTGGAGIRVSGTGTESNPYLVESIGSGITGALTVTDTPTLNLTMGGSGTVADPYQLSGVATLSMEGLSDIKPGAVPASGQVPVFNGTTWEFAVPPTTPPGAVNVGTGLAGDGAAATPIRARTSGTWGTAPLNQMGTNSTLAAPVFVDSAGDLRVLGDAKLTRATSPTAAIPSTAGLDWNDADVHIGIFGQTTQERGLIWHRWLGAGNKFGKIYLTENTDLGTMGILAADGMTTDTYSGAHRATLYQRSDGQTFRAAWAAGASTSVVRPLPFAMAVGVAQLPGNANASRLVTVTFPAGRFTEAPFTLVTPHISTSNASTINTEVWSYTGIASFQIGINRSNDTQVGVHWLAVQLDKDVPDTLFTPLQARFHHLAELWESRAAELLAVDSYVRCETPGCSNAGIPIPVESTWTDGQGNTHPVDDYLCGVCETRLVLGGGVLPTVGDVYTG
jgi:hypothetical protein